MACFPWYESRVYCTLFWIWQLHDMLIYIFLVLSCSLTITRECLILVLRQASRPIALVLYVVSVWKCPLPLGALRSKRSFTSALELCIFPVVKNFTPSIIDLRVVPWWIVRYCTFLGILLSSCRPLSQTACSNQLKQLWGSNFLVFLFSVWLYLWALRLCISSILFSFAVCGQLSDRWLYVLLVNTNFKVSLTGYRHVSGHKLWG